jgi:hypothetical protein
MKVSRWFFAGKVIGVTVLAGFSTLVLRTSMAVDPAVFAAPGLEDPAFLSDADTNGLPGDEFEDPSQESPAEAAISPLVPTGSSLGVGGRADTDGMTLLLCSWMMRIKS